MSHHNPPGWGTDSPLDILIARVPQSRYGVAIRTRYLPDATEIVSVTIDDNGDVVFTAEGPKPVVVARLVAWLGRSGL